MKHSCLLSRPCVVLGAWMLVGSALAGTHVETIAQGLNNPRGIALAPNGWLYVAETGSGGSGTCIPRPGQGSRHAVTAKQGAARIDRMASSRRNTWSRTAVDGRPGWLLRQSGPSMSISGECKPTS